MQNEIIDENEKIIGISSFSNTLIIFFKSGKIIVINPSNGELITNKYFKLNNIMQIRSINQYILIDRTNGKTTILTQ